MIGKWNWAEKRDKPAFLALEDGTVMRGYCVGARRDDRRVNRLRSRTF